MTKKTKNGFTLLELLVVIAIIGLLATVVLFAVNDARAKGRDSARIQQMKQIKTAIELFYDSKGYYPECNSVNPYPFSYCDTIHQGIPVYGTMNSLEIVPTYISKIKNDPTNSGNYGYFYARGWIKSGVNSISSTGKITDYILGMRLEKGGGPVYSGWSSSLNWLEGSQ